MKTKICIITGSRAEYGLLYPLMKSIQEDEAFILQILVTGMHLSPEFGLTYKEIENDGFQIHEKVEMLLSSDTDAGITKSTGLGMIGFADTFNRLKPDLVILLGDRFETFAATTAAYFAKIPIAHLHGGEVTEGATDEGLRHAITKMAYWHFTSTEEYRKRVIQLGENPERVFNVGAIGIDNIRQIKPIDKKLLSEDLKFDLDSPFLLITYHPVTLENNSAEHQFSELLKALSFFPSLRFIFTKPNADANGRIIIKLIDDFVKNNANNSAGFVSLGQKRYLSLMQYTQAVVGNSSSGLIEAPSFYVPTVNIGDRQKGRIRAESVIDARPDSDSLVEALNIVLSDPFVTSCKKIDNPYGNGHTTQQIMRVLKEKQIPENLKKPFYDL
jgi:GDP/UDP-N,N'-diacetylbacillosamine 2-epimerase (hydrolysing)